MTGAALSPAQRGSKVMPADLTGWYWLPALRETGLLTVNSIGISDLMLHYMREIVTDGGVNLGEVLKGVTIGATSIAAVGCPPRLVMETKRA